MRFKLSTADSHITKEQQEQLAPPATSVTDIRPRKLPGESSRFPIFNRAGGLAKRADFDAGHGLSLGLPVGLFDRAASGVCASKSGSASRSRKISLLGILAPVVLLLGVPATPGQTVRVIPIPEFFGVMDVVPANSSPEAEQNSEPSLAVGTGTSYGKLLLHAFSDGVIDHSYPNVLYTNALWRWQLGFGLGDPPWGTYLPSFIDQDATLDWGSAANCYVAQISSDGSVDVLSSSDPTANVPFNTIPGANIPTSMSPDQPGIHVVNVANTDHIFVGFTSNTVTKPVACVRYSLTGGSSWNTIVLDNQLPLLGDFAGVRLALSGDGTTVYAMFQRANLAIQNGLGGTDYIGDIVLKADYCYGDSGFCALDPINCNGVLVAHNIVLPSATTLGAQRLGSAGDLAFDPNYFNLSQSASSISPIYIAYTEEVQGIPVVRVKVTPDGGSTFNLVFSTNNAALPCLAVSSDATVGLLYLAKLGANLEVHFLKAPSGDFSNPDQETRVLARFPNGTPKLKYHPYLGDYFTLRAVGRNFFGAFCASNDPKPQNFPCLAFYQRSLAYGPVAATDSLLLPGASLDDGSGGNFAGVPVAASIDPFIFYDRAPYNFYWFPINLSQSGSMSAPHRPSFGWQIMPTDQAPFQLQSATEFDANAAWGPETNRMIIATNGEFRADLLGPEQQKFFRLARNVRAASFPVFAVPGNNGALNPHGKVSIVGTANQVFTATPSNGFTTQWILDGKLAQSGGLTFAVSNVTIEHTLLASFMPSNDLMVALSELPVIPGPALTQGTNVYMIDIQNVGLSALSGITMTNLMPGNVTFLSATSSQGNVGFSGGVVSGAIGSLGPGASANVTITFVPPMAGAITDVVSVACSQFEPIMANNAASDVTTVIDPVMITTQPASQLVASGTNVTFTVGASGTGPFVYQWFFNGVALHGYTDDPMMLMNVTPSQSGQYSATVSQIRGPEDILTVRSAAATLTVSP